MYSRILVPLDGLPSSEAILPYARALASALNLPVELLRVTKFRDALLYDENRRSMDYLKKIQRSFSPSLTIKCSVAEGEPMPIIISKAAADSGTLIAMSTGGCSAVRQWLVGSLADRVGPASANPILLVRATSDSRTTGEAALESILVPLDGSSLAESALPHAVEMAKQLKLGVALIMVYSTAPLDFVAAAYMPAPQRAAVSSRRGAQIYLEDTAQELRGQGLERVTWQLLEGDAQSEITKVARQMSGNLVVMGTHGRSGIGRWMAGSVTEWVVRHSGAPVVAIRLRPDPAGLPRREDPSSFSRIPAAAKSANQAA